MVNGAVLVAFHRGGEGGIARIHEEPYYILENLEADALAVLESGVGDAAEIITRGSADMGQDQAEDDDGSLEQIMVVSGKARSA